jgi:glyoxylase-like metal-dependent hydrolase (beta-lactamase superfamily II)
MSSKVNAKIRMYRLNELGDCFLVSFSTPSATSNLLIDCGSFRNGKPSADRLREIVKDGIMQDLGGKPIDVVVGTHQHNDHVSGFVHCEKEFRDIGIEQVWLSWLDDPKDKKARRIGEDYNNFKNHLAASRARLQSKVPKKNEDPAKATPAARALGVLNDVLGFYGASTDKLPAELPQDAYKILKRLGKKAPLYLRPGQTLDMPGLPEGTVRVHVLGPPRTKHTDEEEDPLFRKDPREGESYDHSLAAAKLHAFRFMTAAKKYNDSDETRDEEHYPFKKSFKKTGPSLDAKSFNTVISRYRNRDESWRKIEDDWMQQAESLALWIDTFTNNSSLVLAIELVQSRKILLFVADAQTGNWASWKDVKWEDAKVNTDDLLKRTVFYKVGHHASHNATLVEAFDKVTSSELVALIPVHKKDPNIAKKKGGWKMPAKNLFKKLVNSTNNRVLQMDGVHTPKCDPTKEPARSSWKEVGIKPKITDMAIELEIKG